MELDTHIKDKNCCMCAASWRNNPLSNPRCWYPGKIGKNRETRNSYLLFMESRNESRHLVFWSLGTPTGLRDRVRGLIA